MRNAEAKVCRAVGPRWEAPVGAGGQAVGKLCLERGWRIFHACLIEVLTGLFQ